MARNIPENEDDFIRMQQEAIRRVREMQERARRTLENAGMPIAAPAPPPAEAAAADPPSAWPLRAADGPAPVIPSVPDAGPSDPGPREPEPRRPGNGRPPAGNPSPPPRNPVADLLTNPLQNVFHLSLDSEQLLLLGLAYMLYRDNADIYLILALVFIMLT